MSTNNADIIEKNGVKIVTVCNGFLANNTYIVYGAGSSSVIIIDPSYGYEMIHSILQELEVQTASILLTHGHADHIASVARLVAQYNAKVYIHEADQEKCCGDSSLYTNSGWSEFKTQSFEPDVLLCDNQVLDIASLSIKVIHTAGHSRGSCCYLIGEVLFAGDTLFRLSYGRYDFIDGDFDALYSSIVDKLFALEGDYMIMSGHGETSMLSLERNHNEILNDRYL